MTVSHSWSAPSLTSTEPPHRWIWRWQAAWRTLRAHWKLVALLALLGLASSLAALAGMGPRYRAETTLLLMPQAEDPLGNAGWHPSVPNALSTQLALLKSEAVAKSVVQSLSLSRDLDWQKRWQEGQAGPARGDMDTWVARQLLTQLRVTPQRDADVVALSIEAARPDRAAVLANAWAQAFLNFSQQSHQAPAQSQRRYFEAEEGQARQAWEAALQSLKTFLQTHQVVLGEAPPDLAWGQPRADGNPNGQAEPGHLSQLRTEWARLQAEHISLQASLGPQHPQVMQLSRQASLAQTLAQEAQSQWQSEQSQWQAWAQSSQQRQQAWWQAQRQAWLRDQPLRQQALALQREVQAAEQRLAFVEQKAHLARLSSQIPFSAARVLSPATPPTTPVLAKTSVLLASALASLFLGVLCAFVLERWQPRPRHSLWAAHQVDLPLLAHIHSVDSSSPRQSGVSPS